MSLLHLFSAIRAPQTVNDVLSAFDKNISDLKVMQEREIENANYLQQESDLLSSQAKSSRAEAERAGKVSTRLAALIAS